MRTPARPHRRLMVPMTWCSHGCSFGRGTTRSSAVVMCGACGWILPRRSTTSSGRTRVGVSGSLLGCPSPGRGSPTSLPCCLELLWLLRCWCACVFVGFGEDFSFSFVCALRLLDLFYVPLVPGWLSVVCLRLYAVWSCVYSRCFSCPTCPWYVFGNYAEW